MTTFDGATIEFPTASQLNGSIGSFAMTSGGLEIDSVIDLDSEGTIDFGNVLSVPASDFTLTLILDLLRNGDDWELDPGGFNVVRAVLDTCVPRQLLHHAAR